MTQARLHYTKEVRGNLFWQPTPAMREKGFEPKPLGARSPKTEAEARKLYGEWLKVKDAPLRVTNYPPGTFGAFFDRITGRYTKTPVAWWKTLSPRSREDYHRAWRYIDAWRPEAHRALLSRTVVTDITVEVCEAFAGHMEGFSDSERYRALKCLKKLMADAVRRLRLDYESPAAGLLNPQAAGRSAFWLRAEVNQLSKKAGELKYEGMALAIRVGWETMFSPIDVWSLPRSALKQDAGGWYVHRGRTKTDKEAFGALSAGLAADLLAYMESQPFDYTPDTPILRQRNGHAYRSKDTFGDDFRAVRNAAYPGDTRTFADLRRSGNIEADAAGADKKTMGELLANGLADSAFLDATYTPPTVTKAREVALKRAEGGAKLAAEITRVRSNSGG